MWRTVFFSVVLTFSMRTDIYSYWLCPVSAVHWIPCDRLAHGAFIKFLVHVYVTERQRERDGETKRDREMRERESGRERGRERESLVYWRQREGAKKKRREERRKEGRGEEG